MRVPPWQIMLGLSALLVIFALVTTLGQLDLTTIVVIVLFGASLIAAMYLGWRIGRSLRE